MLPSTIKYKKVQTTVLYVWYCLQSVRFLGCGSQATKCPKPAWVPLGCNTRSGRNSMTSRVLFRDRHDARHHTAADLRFKACRRGRAVLSFFLSAFCCPSTTTTEQLFCCTNNSKFEHLKKRTRGFFSFSFLLLWPLGPAAQGICVFRLSVSSACCALSS